MNDYNDEGVRAIMAATVIQAVKDWRWLCRLTEEDRIITSGPRCTKYKTIGGRQENARMSVYELRRFFAFDAETMTDLDTEIMLVKLNAEMRTAERKRARLKKGETKR